MSDHFGTLYIKGLNILRSILKLQKKDIKLRASKHLRRGYPLIFSKEIPVHQVARLELGCIKIRQLYWIDIPSGKTLNHLRTGRANEIKAKNCMNEN